MPEGTGASYYLLIVIALGVGVFPSPVQAVQQALVVDSPPGLMGVCCSVLGDISFCEACSSFLSCCGVTSHNVLLYTWIEFSYPWNMADSLGVSRITPEASKIGIIPTTSSI